MKTVNKVAKRSAMALRKAPAARVSRARSGLHAPPRRRSRSTRDHFEWFTTTIRDAVIFLDFELRVQFANDSYYQIYRSTPEDTIGRSFFQVSKGQWDFPRMRELLEQILPEEGKASGFEITHTFERLGKKTLLVNGQLMRDGNGQIVVSIADITEQRLGIQRLQEGLRYITSVVDTVREPLLVLDERMTVVMANRSFYKTFHESREETEGRLLFDLGNGQWDIPDLQLLLRRVVKGERFDNFLVTHRFEDLGERTMLLNACKLRQNGEKLLLAIEDVTESKHTEQALKNSEVRYRRLFEMAQDGILIIQADTRKICDANRCVQEILACTREELLGKELWEIGLAKDIEASKSMFQELYDKGYARYDNLPLLRKDGRIAEVEFISNVYQVDSQSFVQCDIRDVTDRKQREEALKQSEYRFRTLAEGIPQLVWTSTPEGDRDFLSQQWVRYTGIPEVEGLGMGWVNSIHPEDRCRSCNAWKAAILEGRKFEMEYRLRRSDGQYRWFKLSAVPLRTNEKIVKWCGTYTDIQVQKEIQAALRHAREQVANHAAQLEKEVAERTARLQEMNAELEAFSNSVSHDLRAPLHTITGFSQILMEETASLLNPTQKDCLNRIAGAATRLERLIEDVLNFGRVAHAEVKVEPLNLEPVINQIIQQYPNFQLPHADVQIEGPLLKVLANETSLTQCITNLLSNAVTYVPPGVMPKIVIRSQAMNSHVRVWFEDNGIGIDPKNQARIFSMFERVESRGYPGTGVGLAIVRKAVERMGGSVGVESELGQGSRFWLELARA